MKKLLFFIASFLLSFNLFSQTEIQSTDCNYYTNKIDEFTKAHIVKLKYKRIGYTGHIIDESDPKNEKIVKGLAKDGLTVKDLAPIQLLVRFCSTDNVISADFNVRFSEGINAFKVVFVENKSKIFFLFSDDSIIEIPFIKTDAGSISSNKYILDSSIIPSDDNIKDLATKQIKKIRIMFSDSELDFDLHNPDIIKKQLRCVKM